MFYSKSALSLVLCALLYSLVSSSSSLPLVSVIIFQFLSQIKTNVTSRNQPEQNELEGKAGCSKLWFDHHAVGIVRFKSIIVECCMAIPYFTPIQGLTDLPFHPSTFSSVLKEIYSTQNYYIMNIAQVRFFQCCTAAKATLRSRFSEQNQHGYMDAPIALKHEENICLSFFLSFFFNIFYYSCYLSIDIRPSIKSL